MEKAERKSLVVKLYNDIKFANLSTNFSKKYNENLNKTHYHISALYFFLKDNPELTDDEIREILNSNNKFSNLRKLDKLIPNFFEELKEHGISYVENLYNAKKNGVKSLNISRC
ncbi:MAG: hypothetical protein J6Q13_03475 [Clostridia bacterium]|nr:hypothetical protein [Clostridia bacterium]